MILPKIVRDCSWKMKKIFPWLVEQVVSSVLHPLVDVDVDFVYDDDNVVCLTLYDVFSKHDMCEI
jgi:hypothetical protein